MAQRTKKKSQSASVHMTPLSRRIIALIFLFLIIVSAFQMGKLGAYFHIFFVFFFGSVVVYLFYILVGILSLYTLYSGLFYHFLSAEIMGAFLLFISAEMLLLVQKDFKGITIFVNYLKHRSYPQGGLFGALFYGLFSQLFDVVGALIGALLILSIAIILLYSFIYSHYKNYRNAHPKKNIEKNVEPIKEESNKIMIRKKTPKFFDFMKQEKEITLFPDDVFEDHQDSYIESEITDAFSFNENTLKLDIEEKTKTKQKNKPIEKKETIIEHNPQIISSYQLPTYKLLNPITRNKKGNDDSRAAKSTALLLENLLKQFGVNAHVEDYHIGPTVTKYELKLDIGTRVNKILSLQDDIQLALAAKEIRIEAPIPGKPFVGVEIPNKSPSMVPFNEIFQLAMRHKSWSNKLAVPLGKDIEGNLVVAELNKMPHLLIAGATGSGKSVCVNVIITSLLMKASPEEVRLILVDPKKVELSNYNGVPHLLAPVVTDAKKAAGVLQEVVNEMERRYEVFAANNQRNISSYNEFAGNYNNSHDDKKEIMPYHVVILDEVADLMMVASKTVEDCIMRISQMARAAGIHMIVATQRPSTNIITGVIKANIPSRIAFAVSSQIDSRTILDASGAEKLLGKGDMLFSPMDASSPVRVQGAYVDDSEVARIVDFASHQMETNYEDKYVNAKELSNDKSNSDDDPFAQEDEEYEECRDFVIQMQKASTSLLQRKFHIGYNKAARIMDQLEENGVIGPQIGSKPREVYIQSYSEEQL